MPYINRPFRNRPAWMDYISRYIDPPEDSPPATSFTVDLAPFPSHFLPNGRAVFPITKRKDAVRIAKHDVRPDTVIFATGYTQEFSFFDKDGGYKTPGEADIRNVAASGDESVGFIGFVRPGVGARLSLHTFYATILILAHNKILFPRCYSTYSGNAGVLLDLIDKGRSPKAPSPTILPLACQRDRPN